MRCVTCGKEMFLAHASDSGSEGCDFDDRDRAINVYQCRYCYGITVESVWEGKFVEHVPVCGRPLAPTLGLALLELILGKLRIKTRLEKSDSPHLNSRLFFNLLNGVGEVAGGSVMLPGTMRHEKADERHIKECLFAFLSRVFTEPRERLRELVYELKIEGLEEDTPLKYREIP